MSLKTKLTAIFSILVFTILILNNTLSYFSTKELLIKDSTSQMKTLAKQIAIDIDNSTKGARYVEDLIGERLRLVSIAVQSELDPDVDKVTNEQLAELSAKYGVAQITLLKRTKDNIVGVKSSDPLERDLSTKEWGYPWYDAFNQLFKLENVNVNEGQTLPHYWSGPISSSSSDPTHVDKWGYYYDGTTNYIINPYVRDQQVMEYTGKIGPESIAEKSLTANSDVLEITGFNPETFGKPPKWTDANGQHYIDFRDRDVQFGAYTYQSKQDDVEKVELANSTGETKSTVETVNGHKVLKSFIPVKADPPYVIGLVMDYRVVQDVLDHQLWNNAILSLIFLIIVLIIGYALAGYIVKPLNRILFKVNEVAAGSFGDRLVVNRTDELGRLMVQVNTMSDNLEAYTSELEEKKTEVEYFAYHDFLTGLPNRRFFSEHSRLVLEQARRSGKPLAVMFLDLDRFKFINDVFGHSAGDVILQSVAERIQKLLSGSSASRIGGDEFMILLPETDRDLAVRNAQELLDLVSQPYNYEGNELFVTPSVGISMYPTDGESIEVIMKNADRAMYRAKEQGRNNFQFFLPDMQDLISQRVNLEKSLRKALDRAEFILHYQPQFCLETGAVVGCEALVRWQHPELGLVSPAEIIPLAEETGLIVPIGEWVLRTACRQNKKWQEAGIPPIRIAVNLSARQFQQQNLVETIIGILQETGLDPQLLELEITESIAMNNEDYVIQKLQSLKDLGIKLSIDDFGSGYSSLNYLKRFPIHTLKIDRSFLADIDTESGNAEIIAAIISMARTLKVSVVSEGVETVEQMQFLQEHHCQVAQGFLLSKPLSVHEFEETFYTIQETAVSKISG